MSSQRWDFNSELLQWLQDHKELLQFIQIDACPTNLSPEQEARHTASIEMRRQTQILRISRFRDAALKVLLDNLQVENQVERPPWDADFKAMKLFHISLFLSEKLVRMKKKDIQKAMEDTQTLLDLLLDPKIVPASVDVSIDEAVFTKTMMAGSMKYLVMSEYQKVVKADLAGCYSRPASQEQMARILNRLLETVALQVDKKTFYFPNTMNEQRFEQWLLCDAFPFKEEVSNVLGNFQNEPRKLFPKRIIELYVKIGQFFGVVDPVQASCAIILLFRVIFGRAYAEDSKFFYKGEKIGLQTIGKRVPITFLEVEEGYLPEHEEGSFVYDVFRQDKLFRRAARHLEYAFLATNPIDAIFEIHEMLMYIQHSVTSRANGNGGMMSFETTFGLYVGAMLASDIPCFEELAEFICDFAPSNGLCPEFEFTCTTTTAALNYCGILREKFM